MSADPSHRSADDKEDDAARSGAIASKDSFLVQVRGGSRPAERAVSGRVEHLYSGQSEPFQSLTELLEFLAKHFSEAGSMAGRR